MGGSSVSRYAEVLSLKRLSDRVAAFCGGAARAYLDKGGRLLNMASAAEQVSAKIKLYAAVLKRPEFLVDLVAMTEEFQSYCLEPQTLLEAAGRAQGQFAQKLQELGLLYEAYLSVTDQGAADPAGRMTRLEQQLLETDWGACRTFYIDGFSDFTGAEYRVLEALLRRSRGVFLTLATGEKESAITPPGARHGQDPPAPGGGGGRCPSPRSPWTSGRRGARAFRRCWRDCFSAAQPLPRTAR